MVFRVNGVLKDSGVFFWGSFFKLKAAPYSIDIQYSKYRG